MKYFRRTDLIVIAVLLLSAAAVFLFSGVASGGGNVAFVYYFQKPLAEIDLTAGEQVFSFPDAENVIIKTDGDGNIYFYESDCPNKVCIRSGRLSRAGQSAACLPNGIIVNVRARSERAEFDVIVE